MKLAKFMGHDIRVHREFYQLLEETLQVAKVSKLLLASEQGRSDLQGKTLDDIDVSVDEGEYTHKTFSCHIIAIILGNNIFTKLKELTQKMLSDNDSNAVNIVNNKSVVPF